MKFFLKSSALKQLKKLPAEVQKRIIRKLEFFCEQEDPLEFCEPLASAELGSYRFRIGDYRVIFDIIDTRIDILTIGHRRDIYR
ncbi:type II toxin-antitoxin system RelE/ParE family toxin [Candidatus Uhrbacteria bacterium]|nr:type II toxin-antitoxin system RelE/ParE family toxin [Candidatus Uhrbacteria bacterium]